MRDAGKWTALLALVYSQLVGLGAAGAVEWIRGHVSGSQQRDVAAASLAAIVIAVPLYYGNGVLYGMHGQIRPSAYPVGWYQADDAISRDSQHGRALFLPWHGYFVNNTNQVVMNPATTFFSVPIVASTDLEIPGVTSAIDPDQQTIANLIRSGADGDWGHILALRNIKYVLLAHEADWQRYQFLDRLSSLHSIGDFGTITVYRNMVWSGST
jgi:hypothetical protein